jgi:hypothetical protein
LGLVFCKERRQRERIEDVQIWKPQKSRLLPLSPRDWLPLTHALGRALYVVDERGRSAIEGRSSRNAPLGEQGHHSDCFVPESQTIGHRRLISLAPHVLPSFLERILNVTPRPPTGKSTYYGKARTLLR